jgi:hypothetical protein
MRDPSGQWTVRFMNRDIVMPLNRESLWLNWDSAVSITGHDIEAKILCWSMSHYVPLRKRTLYSENALFDPRHHAR